jgi:serine/threonine-protein kinase
MTERGKHVTAPTVRMDAVAPPTGDLFAVGSLLAGTYEIRGILGHGGMGQVYDAYDTKLARPVAIKVAWPNVGAAAVRNEAQALAAIRHPAMVAVYACGEHEGTEFVVMERVPGVTLASHLRRRLNAGKPLSLAEILGILGALADGLGAVHRAGIAHRDVKPDNVMLAPSGRVVLMDFGVFLPEFAVSASSASGSPGYMAPETISGAIASGGGFLVDVYAFGVIAFELATGDLPFRGDTASEFFVQHLSSEPPSLRDVRPERPELGGSFDGLVRQLLAKDPLERPQSMDEITHQLRRVTDASGPLSARIPVPASSRGSGRFVVEESPPIADDEGNARSRTRG